MRCREATETIHLLFDGDVDTAAKADLDRHIARCEQCRKTLAEMKALFSAFGPPARPVAGSGREFAEEVMAKIRVRESVRRLGKRKRKLLLVKVGSPVAAAALSTRC